MKSFQWDKHFETGLSEVDHEHRRLVDLINEFGDHLSGNDVSFTDIEGIFRELSDYAQHHFREEEEMMSRIGIDKRHIDMQIETHQNFIQEIESMHDSVSPDNPAAAKHLLDFLVHWLAYHILGVDQNMAKQVKAVQSGSRPSDAYEKFEREADDATQPLLIALNTLFKQVSARNKELSQLNRSLEEKVADRTRALSEANSHLEEIALTDVLTGLPNRRHAMRRLIDLWNEALEEKTSLVCLMIDADHFKEVNDTYGHDAGDDVLRQLARTLRHAVRNDDILCRLGGDEFFVICPDTDKDGGLHVAEHLRISVFELRVPTGDGTWHGSISVGVAVKSADMVDHEALIKLADEGVYAAKRDGKNCVRTTG